MTALATTLAIVDGAGADAVWVAAAIGAGQLHVGWTNDYVDRHRDAADRRRDKPVASGELSSQAVGRAALIALPVAATLSFARGKKAAAAHLLALLAAGAYNLGLKSTPLSPLPYSVAFAALPAVISLGQGSRRLPRPGVLVASALLGIGAHFAQGLGDIRRDRNRGEAGLPQRLGERKSAAVAAVLLGAASLIAIPPGSWRRPATAACLGLTLTVAGGVMGAALSERPRLAFRLALMAAAGACATLATSGSGLAVADRR